MQVDPIKPMLKAPGTRRFKLHYVKLHSDYAFKCYLRRYNKVLDELIESQPAALAGHIPDVVAFCVEVAQAPGLATVTRRRALDVVAFLARHKPKAGAYTRSLLSST